MAINDTINLRNKSFEIVDTPAEPTTWRGLHNPSNISNQQFMLASFEEFWKNVKYLRDNQYNELLLRIEELRVQVIEDIPPGAVVPDGWDLELMVAVNA